jgi:hypothetical protein
MLRLSIMTFRVVVLEPAVVLAEVLQAVRASPPAAPVAASPVAAAADWPRNALRES